MTNGVLSLDDVQASSNDTGSTESETNNGDSSTSELQQACEAIGADFDHASEYVSEHGKEDDLVEFARRLANDAELHATMAEYRRGNGVNRIIQNHLRGADADFTVYTGAFYGDSDDPEPGTYNDVQQRAREMDGNLMFYQALFPEPCEEYWDSEPVLWQEFDTIGYGDDLQDTHIFVTREFVEEYSGRNSITVNGEEKPVPPSDEMLSNDGGSSGSASVDAPFDPEGFTNDGVENKLDTNDYSLDQLNGLLQAEKAGDNRKGAKNAIRDAIDAAEQTASGGDSDSGASAAQAAGEMTGSAGDSIPPEKVEELMDNGWTKDEIIELYG